MSFEKMWDQKYICNLEMWLCTMKTYVFLKLIWYNKDYINS